MAHPFLALALTLTLGQLSGVRLAEPGAQAELSADLAEVDVDEHLVRAEGHTMLESGGLQLRAELLTFDTEAREASASGEVLFVDGELLLLARDGTFSLQGEHGLTVHGAELFQKRGLPPGALLGASDPAAARALGKSSLTLKAETLTRIAQRRYLVEQLTFTPCDCKGSTPDWSITASSADIIPGERALLYGPVVRVRDVPVLILPALYLPLSSRRTGLLFPRPSFNARSGFGLEQPLFVTLGESWDVTFTFGYRFGQKQPSVPYLFGPPTFAEPLPPFHEPTLEERTSFPRRVPFVPLGRQVITESPARVGPQGPSLSTELRYVPSEYTHGRLFVGLLDDLHRDDAPCQVFDAVLQQTVTAPCALARRGLRGELSWKHVTELPSGRGARADVSLVSDAFYLSDAAVNVLRDAPPYLRSSGQLWQRGDDSLIYGGVQWYQDLNPQSPRSPSQQLFGPDAPAVTQRLPVAGLSIPKTRVLGPVLGALEVVAVHYQPVAPFGSIAIPGADAPLTRLDVAPSLSLPLVTEGPLRVALHGGARADVDSGAGTGRRSELHALGGISAGTELSRTFGEGEGALRHAIAPRVELRFGSPGYGRSSRTLYDEFDRPMPAEGMAQGVASVVNRFTRRAGLSTTELARLELGQGFDLQRRLPADAFARLDLNREFVGCSALARYDVPQRRFSTTSLSGRVNDSRGDSLYASYERLLKSGTDRMRAGIDALVGVPSAAIDALHYDQIGAGLSIVPFTGLSLRYGATFHPVEGKFLQHTAGVSFGTACDCWRVDLSYSQIPGASPYVGFLLDLKEFGTVGGGG